MANKRQLKRIWKQLDNACGNLDNAFIEIAELKEGLSEDGEKSLDRIDFSAIVNLKNEIEFMIEKKGEK